MLGSLPGLQARVDLRQLLPSLKLSFAQIKDVAPAMNANRQQLVGILMLKLSAQKDFQLK
jgi:hypothetical protein